MRLVNSLVLLLLVINKQPFFAKGLASFISPLRKTASGSTCQKDDTSGRIRSSFLVTPKQEHNEKTTSFLTRSFKLGNHDDKNPWLKNPMDLVTKTKEYTNQAKIKNDPTEMKYAFPLNTTKPLEIIPSIGEIIGWNTIINTLQRDVLEITREHQGSQQEHMDGLLKDATNQMEIFMNLIHHSATQILKAEDPNGIQSTAEVFVHVAEQLAKEKGLNMTDAAERARATTRDTMGLMRFANDVVLAGYIPSTLENTEVEAKTNMINKKALFAGFNVRDVPPTDMVSSVMASAMAELSGAVYDRIDQIQDLGHTLVAHGTTADVAWVITDGVAMYSDCEGEKKIPTLARTITIRGMDASDENVDRERLLNKIFTATPEVLGSDFKDVKVHSGLLSIGKELYKDLAPYIDATAPSHKLVFNGHSIGGSLSELLLMLLVNDRGVGFVRKKILNVFTFGAPPIATLTAKQAKRRNVCATNNKENSLCHKYHCDILDYFGLPSSIVRGFVQPWDPIARFFSEIDPLYPIVDDIGEDGNTLYASGPARALRPITRAVVESWEGWSHTRDTFRNTVNQNYVSIGVQHMLLPESIRYLTDRFVSVNVAVPPIEKIVQISPGELMPALDRAFPLDVFSISFVPAALRSFVHHFYPAYTSPFASFATQKSNAKIEAVAEDKVEMQSTNDEAETSHRDTSSKIDVFRVNWADTAAEWILGGIGSLQTEAHTQR